MKLVKLLLLSTCISSLIAAILLLWNESEVSCGVVACKVMETMFIIVAVVTSKEAASINCDKLWVTTMMNCMLKCATIMAFSMIMIMLQMKC